MRAHLCESSVLGSGSTRSDPRPPSAGEPCHRIGRHQHHCPHNVLSPAWPPPHSFDTSCSPSLARLKGSLVLIAEADIRTERPSRYLAQLCEHTSETGVHISKRVHLSHGGPAQPQIKSVEWTDTHGTIDLVGGRCSLRAGPDSLTLRVEAADRDSLQRIQHLVAARMRKIDKRDAPHVTWRQAEAADHHSDDLATAGPASAIEAAHHPRRRAALGLIAVIALVVAVHLGLGGLLMASGPTTHWFIGAALAIVLLHILGTFVIRRRKTRRTR
ncbi:DUF2218 domain-containing protein [Streptomyces sp. AS58]|uniref:DUF2218 domain-containing protein n=1 Tax=Streptomyces sp. AS58 TaxID=1519489 RepID=UPI00099CCC97